MAGAKEISLGKDYGCWRTDDVSRYCLGVNDQGQMANGEVDAALATTPVLSAFPPPLAQIRSSYYFSCAVQGDSGAVHCTGGNTLAECDPHASNTAPVLDASSTPALPRAARVVALSAYGGCAIVGDDTEVSCWAGSNNGENGAASGYYGVVQTDGGTLTGVVGLAGGVYFFCAVTYDGHVYCWGQDVEGYLGRGEAGVDTASPVAAPVVDGDGGILGGVVHVAAENAHTCALKANGEVWCWGGNEPADGRGLDASSGPVAIPRRAF
jgi:alpha-tubulin suppressor-like RCC1 family protein